MRDPKDEVDYAASGKSVRAAFLEQARRERPVPGVPPKIVWSGRVIQTADAIRAPHRGVVRAQILSEPCAVVQGFDLNVDGWLELADGSRVQTLRTWHDPSLSPQVEYRFLCKDGLLWTWNVYQVVRPDGATVEEKWTENAGMWIEHVSERERVYHCSHGYAVPPDFESLVYKVEVAEM
ncbi:MAG: hypothetical protein IT377_03515 [Polyangiaceae bacterium]|nr:hypothetical protein [Polyangiaceae bacterium]